MYHIIGKEASSDLEKKETLSTKYEGVVATLGNENTNK
jgi:hypothetical protein